MEWFKRKRENGGGSAATQIRGGGQRPFGMLLGTQPLLENETKLYRMIREQIPVIDAAIYKLVRLSGGMSVRCGDAAAQVAMDDFLRTVGTGRGQYGMQSFLEAYFESLLTCGRAVGEIVPRRDGRGIAALLCQNVDYVEVQEGTAATEFALCSRDERGKLTVLPRQELLLFTPLNPETEHPYGVSLLRSMPFLSEILMKIYQTVGRNWEHCGNMRFSVVYRPQGEELDRSSAQERAEQIAREWSSAMQDGGEGRVRDFVSVGDVSIKAIGADSPILDSEIPVRQILEQLIAKTGLPPFMLGMNWSSTERMSTQQADILTTEITALRRTVTPVIERICRLWLRMNGYTCDFAVEWDDINLQDEVEQSRAALYREQARKLKIENDAAEGEC